MHPSNSKVPVRWSDIAAGRKSTHPDAAAIKPILDTAELCENVLKYLSLKDLIKAQLICRSVCSVIKTSPLLRNELFMTPTEHSETNVWLFNANRDLFVGKKALQYLDETSANRFKPPPRTIQPLVYNPLLFASKWQDDVNSVGHYLDKPVDYPNEYNTITLRLRAKLRSLSKDASCRSMFLSQPPVTEVHTFIDGRFYYPEWEDRRGLPKWTIARVAKPRIENAEGVTFGQLVDAIVSAMNEHDETSLDAVRAFHGLFLSVQT